MLSKPIPDLLFPIYATNEGPAATTTRDNIETTTVNWIVITFDKLDTLIQLSVHKVKMTTDLILNKKFIYACLDDQV